MPMMLREQQVARKAKPFIIYPNDKRYRIWQNILVTLAFYNQIVSTFVFVFLEEPQTPVFNILNSFVNSFFCFDIFLNFFLAFHHKDTFVIVDNPKKIVQHYLKTWFVVDIICNLPLIVAGIILHAQHHVVYAIFFALQIFWCVGKVLSFFNRLEMDIRFSFVQIRIAKLIWFVLVNLHLRACLIYYLASRHQIMVLRAHE